MSKPEIKRRKTQELRLTQFELLHLRDLMSVCLPPEGKQTLSEALASLENRQLIESMLWKKLSAACAAVGLPTGDDAPYYVVAPTGMTPLGVFQLASDSIDKPGSSDGEDDEEVDSEDISNLFRGKKK